MSTYWRPCFLTLLLTLTKVLGQSVSVHAASVQNSSTSAIAQGSGSSSGSSGSSGHAEQSPAEIAMAQIAEIYNVSFERGVLVALSIAAIVVMNYFMILHAVRYLRMLACLNNDTQRYFRQPNTMFAKLKEHLIYAPLFRTRHNREFQLSSAINMGTLPTRFQTMFLTGLVAMNVTYCVIYIHWSEGSATYLDELRNRSGTLSVVNMVPLVLMAARNNPLIQMLGVSFDTFNLLHRWLGRIVVIEAVVHTLAWTIGKINESGWETVKMAVTHSKFLWTGLIGTVAFLALFLHSPSPIRHAFYETFLHLHIFLAIVAIIGVWVHLDGFDQQKYLLYAVSIWVFERFTRMVWIIYRNVGAGGTMADVEVLPGEALRVTVTAARPGNIKAGSHLYFYVPGVSLWMSHPFSIAWTEEEEVPLAEKGLALSRQDVLDTHKTKLFLIIRRRTGFTDKLWRKAKDNNGYLRVNALIEGPYGGHETLNSYGTVMLFAGGVGVAHQVPYVRSLVAGYADGTLAVRKVVLVWILQNPEHLEWIRPWMTAVLGMKKRREVLRIMLFVTRPRSNNEIRSPSSTVQMFPGRPNVETLVHTECQEQIGAMAVTVCGTGSLSDDVRRAVRKLQGRANIDFVEEAFSW